MEWKQWPGLPLAERHNLPCHPGIYVVVDSEDQVWYVGLSTNLNTRWNGKGHHRYKQLSRANSKRIYRIHWQFCPVEQLAAQERYYIDRFRPHLNYSRVRSYPRRAIQPYQEISRLFKVLNQKTMLFPEVRSVVLGYYTEVDEDDTGTLKGYTCIVTAVSINDHDRTILNSYKKSYSKKGSNLKGCWGVYESNYGSSNADNKPVMIPIFLSDDIAYEFVCHYKLLDRLEHHIESLHTVELAKQSVLALKDPNALLTYLSGPANTDHEVYLKYRAVNLHPIAELLVVAATSNTTTQPKNE